jgi:hypothetical protein
MSNDNDNKRIDSLLALMAQQSPPAWLVRMRDDYKKTGTYRSEDLGRLLGDPKQGVSPGDLGVLLRNASK